MRQHENTNKALSSMTSSNLSKRLAASGSRAGGWAPFKRLMALMALTTLGTLSWAQTVVTRTVEYEYDAVTGQVKLERVEPGSADCVLNQHRYDAYGNRDLTTTSSCNPTGASFAPRASYQEFAAQPGHPAGAFQTGARAGKPGLDANPALALSRSSASYDPGTGLPLRKVVDAAVATHHLVASLQYDGLGRLVRESAPLRKDGAGNQVDGFVQTKRVYCLGALKAQGGDLEACLNIDTLSTLSIDYRSQLNRDASGQVSSQVRPRIISAYYIEQQSFGPGGEAMGPPGRTHYDSLHRVVAKESRDYSGRWVMELSAYDELGLKVAGWSGIFGRDASGRVTVGGGNIDENRQWVASFDWLHRPTQQQSYWRNTIDGTLQLRSQELRYAGLRTESVLPAFASPDGQERRSASYRDPQGRVLQTVDVYGATLSKAYDAIGNLIQTVDALGNQTTLSYSPGHARFKLSMRDPSTGTWSYGYDGLGQLTSQVDAKGNRTTMAYDELGRVLSKRNPDLNSNWYYDRDASGQPCAGGLNRLCEVISGADPANPAVPRVSQMRYAYDSLGRSTQHTLSSGDRSFSTGVEFDDYGRASAQRYPTGLTVRYSYAGAQDPVPGTLLAVSDAANAGRVFWRIDTLPRDAVFNARGQLLKAQLGNGVITDRRFDPISGKAFALKAGTGGGAEVLDHRYEYDLAGNILRRQESLMGVVDQFEYDRLDRLVTHRLLSSSDAGGANREVRLAYNALGSILEKTDVGGYAYPASGSAQPFAVRAVGGSNYEYDANGQLLRVSGAQERKNDWTAFNHPARMSYGSNSVAFVYDAGYKRLREDFFSAGVLQRRVFLLHPDNAGGLGYEREEVLAGSNRRIEHRHFISVGGDTIAVVKTLGEGMPAGMVQADPALTNYWHKDALGSIVAVSNASGQVLERALFDPWGRRQSAAGAALDLTAGPAHGDRGFTGHEHLDELGLVHMNGRLYDPLLARFVSADPHIQDPDLLQGYNRYSYVLNNPLIYTDPSGEIWLNVLAFAVGAIMAHEGNPFWSMVGKVMMMASLSGLPNSPGLVEVGFQAATNTTIGAVANSAISAGIATAVSPGASLESVIQSMAFAAAFTSIGGSDLGTPGKLMAHSLVGCVQGAVSGGKCGPSAMAAFVGKGFTEATGGVDMHPVTRGVLTMIAGGTASVVGGGKFSNGAAQAGFAYLFNQLATQRVLTRNGHHIVPDEVVRKLGITSTDALKAFDSNDARIPVENHNGARPSPNTVSHAQYNKLSLDEGKKWLEKNKIDPSKMTADQARDMVRHFKTSAPDAIRQFNQVQYSRALDQAIRRAWYRNPGARAPE